MSTPEFKPTRHFLARLAEREIPINLVTETLKRHRRVQDRRDLRTTMLVGERVTVVTKQVAQETHLLTAYWEVA